jgi:hypothetical protein
VLPCHSVGCRLRAEGFTSLERGRLVAVDMDYRTEEDVPKQGRPFDTKKINSTTLQLDNMSPRTHSRCLVESDLQ